MKDILADDVRFSETLIDSGTGMKRTYHLKYMGGQVTDENKQEYLNLVVDYLLKGSIENQILEFKKGFQEIISSELLVVFDWNELELLICGMPDITIEDLTQHTHFSGDSSSHQKENFFRCLRAFTREQRTRFLQFVTGSSSLPVGGLGSLSPKLTVNFTSSMDPQMLPRSHTCFNSVDFPLSILVSLNLMLCILELII